MAITTPPATAIEPPTNVTLAESILAALRLATTLQADTVAEALTEAFLVLLHECGWPRGMARDAINHAMVNNTTIKAALYANQTG